MGSKTAIEIIETGVARMSDGSGSDECALYGFEHRQIVEHIQAQDAEIMRLQAIVAKLPKTTDGVPVVANVDPIWINPDSGGWVGEDPLDIECDQNGNPIPRDPIKITAWAHWGDQLCILLPATEEHFDHWAGEFYSTCEAAEAAREAVK